MKAIYLLILCCIISFNGSSQESNADLLKKAETELSTAIENEEYKIASQLKKEIDLRKQIEDAAAKGDFELAGKLQDELKNLLSGEIEEEADVPTTQYEAPEYNKIPSPSPGMGVVEIIRVTQNDGSYHPIFCDWKLVSLVKGVSHARLELTPGEHLIWAPAENDHYVKINVLEGQTYFIYHDWKIAKVRAPECDLSPVLPTETRRISRGLSVMGKYPAKTFDEKSTVKLEKHMKRMKINIEKAKEKYENGLKDDSKFTKTVRSDQFIPAKYL